MAGAPGGGGQGVGAVLTPLPDPANHDPAGEDGQGEPGRGEQAGGDRLLHGRDDGGDEPDRAHQRDHGGDQAGLAACGAR